jgi:hypothetical protein
VTASIDTLSTAGHYSEVAARAGAIVAGVLALASVAAAAESRLQFSWNAPASCPDRQMVLHQLEAVLEEQTVELDAAAVRGDIERSGSQWVLSLDVQVGSARRVRRLSAESCDDLGKAAAVALALLIHPLRESAAGADEPPAARVEASPQPPVESPSPVRDVERTAEHDQEAQRVAAPLAWQLGADAVVDSSTLAGPALGASIQSHMHLADWAFGAYGLVLPARRRDVGMSGSVEFEQWAAGLRLCRALWNGAWRVDGCLGAELGRFAGRGSGLNQTRNEVRDRWLASSAGLHLGWHVFPHAALVGRVEAVFPIQREKYVINVDDEVHETPHVTARAGLGLQFDLL